MRVSSPIFVICISALLLNCSPTPPDRQADAANIEEFSTASSGSRFLVHHPGFAGKSYELVVYSGYPEIVEWRELPSGNHYLLIYTAGSMGISHQVDVSRAKVINLKTGKEIIDEIWKYTDDAGRPDLQTTNPIWTFTESHLFLKTSGQDEPETIPLR